MNKKETWEFVDEAFNEYVMFQVEMLIAMVVAVGLLAIGYFFVMPLFF